MKAFRNISVAILAFLTFISCSNREEVTPPNNVTPPSPYNQLAGSICGLYLIQGELLWNDSKMDLEIQDEGLTSAKNYCDFYYKDPQKSVTVYCLLTIDGKEYQLKIPLIEVGGEPWHTNFNTETNAILFENEEQIAEGTLTMTGSMDIIGSPTTYPYNYDCSLNIRFSCELVTFEMDITKLINRENG